MKGTYREIRIGKDDVGRRLDRVLRILFHDLSLGILQKSLRTGLIRLNGKKAPGSAILAPNDAIWIGNSLDSTNFTPIPASPLPYSIEFILFENDDILALNKPRGRLTHGPEGLEGAVRHYLLPKISSSLSFMPGPLHRLDRNTTGVLCFSKSLRGARIFAESLKKGIFRKVYLALLDGELNDSSSWVDFLSRSEDTLKTFRNEVGGRRAESLFTPLAARNHHSLAIIELKTGFTHQIRVQAALRGHPLSGDRKYGGSPLAGGYILHAAALLFPSENEGIFPERILAPLPSSCSERLTSLFGEATESGIFDLIAQYCSRRREHGGGKPIIPEKE